MGKLYGFSFKQSSDSADDSRGDKENTTMIQLRHEQTSIQVKGDSA